jgi:hypothetical protein
MTDRFNTLIVVLENEMRSDDASSLMEAITHMRGVLSVSGNVADFSEHMAIERAKRDLGQKLIDIVYPQPKS